VVVFGFIEPLSSNGIASSDPPRRFTRDECEGAERRVSNVYVRFPDAHFSNIVEEDEQIGRINIFKGNDPDKWFSDIPTFNSVRIKNLYSGIDLVLGGDTPDKSIWHYEGISSSGVGKREWTLQPIIESGCDVQYKDEDVIINLPFGRFSIRMPTTPKQYASPFMGEVGKKGGQSANENSVSPFAVQQLLWGNLCWGNK